MSGIPIPFFVDPPELSPALVDEITRIIFGEPLAIEPCDLIFIFGGTHPGLWQSGAQAYFDGLGKAILATGGYKPGALHHHTWQDGQTAEAEVIRRELLRLGVPGDAIFIETRSTNTYENVRFALQVYDFSSVTRVLAVCKSYAVGRQTRTLQAQLAPGVRVIPYPFDTQISADGPLVTRDNWMEIPQARAYLFANVLKIQRYGLAGHLVPLERMTPELQQLVEAYFED